MKVAASQTLQLLNERKDVTFLSQLVEILNKYDGFSQVLSTGEQGAGKTSHAFISMKRIWGSWEEAWKHWYFNLDTFWDEYLNALDRGEHINAICIDDAGKALSKYLFSIEGGAEQAHQFNWVWNTFRTGVRLVILTSPDDDILYELRRKSWITAETWIEELHNRKVAYYTHSISAWNMQRRHSSVKTMREEIFSESFDPFEIPQWFWSEYNRKRRQEVRELVMQIKRAREEATAAINAGGSAPCMADIHDEFIKVYRKEGWPNASRITGVSREQAERIIQRHNLEVVRLGGCAFCSEKWTEKVVWYATEDRPESHQES